MFSTLLRSIGQSLLQDGALTLVGIFTAHGWMTADQTTGFVGSVVFLGMLALNAFLQNKVATTAPPGTEAINTTTGQVQSVGRVIDPSYQKTS